MEAARIYLNRDASKLTESYSLSASISFKEIWWENYKTNIEKKVAIWHYEGRVN